MNRRPSAPTAIDDSDVLVVAKFRHDGLVALRTAPPAPAAGTHKNGWKAPVSRAGVRAPPGLHLARQAIGGRILMESRESGSGGRVQKQTTIRRLRALAAAGACVLAAAVPGAAKDRPASHVRAESADLRQLVSDTAERSPTFRSLVEALDHSDVIVYVQVKVMDSGMLDGRTGFLATARGTRYLMIELAFGRTHVVQSATLGHELQHALEIASASWVVDPATLERYYSRMGEPSGARTGYTMFETRAARETGERVREELIAPPPRIAESY